MSEFEATIVDDPRGVLLRLNGKLEYDAVRDFELAVEQLVETKPRRAVVDAAALTALNSAGIGSLIKLNRRLRDGGGELRVAALNANLRRMLALCNFDRVLKVTDTVEDAFAD